MTPLLTLNLLRVLFVTFCGVTGGIVTSETQDNMLPGVAVGLVFGLLMVLADRLLKGFSLRAFSSATFGIEVVGFPKKPASTFAGRIKHPMAAGVRRPVRNTMKVYMHLNARS